MSQLAQMPRLWTLASAQAIVDLVNVAVVKAQPGVTTALDALWKRIGRDWTDRRLEDGVG